jgi:HK97 family phage prohead protease
MEIERRFVCFADLDEEGLGVEEREAGQLTIRGYCARFLSLSHDLGGFREELQPGCFGKVLQSRKLDVIANFNHSSDHVLGRTKNKTLALREDDKGLFMEIVPPDTQFARDLLFQVRRGDIAGASFAFTVSPKDEVFEQDSRGNTIRKIAAVNGLFDVSVVTTPAYPQASVAVRSFEAWKAAQQKPAASGLRKLPPHQVAAYTLARLRANVAR